MIESIAVRTMAKAEYSISNIGHYGLAFNYYTHFTSPIRRYPDFAIDLKNRGTLDPDKNCIACSVCTQIMRDGGSTGCAVRDKEIYLPIYKQGRKQAAKGSD